MNLQLIDDVAIVFGGANGIGMGIAQAFRNEGARVGLVDLSPDVTSTAMALGGMGIQADATDLSTVELAIDTVTKQLGSVRHVVFAVGCGSGTYGFPFWNVPVSSWHRVLQVNLVAAVNVAQTAAKRFVESRQGTLLFLSSVAAQIGSQTDPPYSAAKAGLLNFMEVCAKDLAPYGVRVNALCPGMVKTELNRSVWQAWHDQQPEGTRRTYEEWTEDKLRRTVPLGRWQTVEDIAQAAVFLASRAAANITGQTLNIDGGQVMHW